MDTTRLHLPASLLEAAGPPLPGEELAGRLADRREGPAAAQLQVVLWAWAADPALETSTVARMGELAVRYASRLAATDVATLQQATLTDAEGFVWAPTRRGDRPALATCHLRRATLRTLYRTLRQLGAAQGDPTLDLRLPPKTQRAARPLDDDEIALLRLAARARRRDRDRAGLPAAAAAMGARNLERVRGLLAWQ